MRQFTFLTTDLLFFAAWLFPIVLALVHRARAVPSRLNEIRAIFFGNRYQKWDEKLPARSPACQYLRCMRPLDGSYEWTRGEVEILFWKQFTELHSWGRYLLPLAFIAVISFVQLSFCRDWVIVRLNQRVATQLVAESGRGNVAAVTDSVQAAHATARASRWSTDRRSGNAWMIAAPTRRELQATPAPIIFAILGATVWAAYEIYSRRYSRDLTPQELSEITVRMIAAIPIGYAFSQIALDKWDSPLAFAAAAFPMRDLQRFMRQRVLDHDAKVPGSERRPTAHLGQLVDGISNETATRLEELNITTPWDLAYADPVSLLARTGYSLRLILTWMDQALLIVYFGPNKGRLGELAIPCALDLREFYRMHCFDPVTRKRKDCAADPALVDLAQKLQIPVSILPDRLYSISVDPQVAFLASTWYPRNKPKQTEPDGVAVPVAPQAAPA